MELRRFFTFVAGTTLVMGLTAGCTLDDETAPEDSASTDSAVTASGFGGPITFQIPTNCQEASFTFKQRGTKRPSFSVQLLGAPVLQGFGSFSLGAPTLPLSTPSLTFDWSSTESIQVVASQKCTMRAQSTAAVGTSPIGATCATSEECASGYCSRKEHVCAENCGGRDPGRCGCAQHASLQSDVNAMCKNGYGLACVSQDCCGTLQAKRNQNELCRNARVTIRDACFPSSKDGHAQAEADAQRAQATCDAYYQSHKCSLPAAQRNPAFHCD